MDSLDYLNIILCINILYAWGYEKNENIIPLLSALLSILITYIFDIYMIRTIVSSKINNYKLLNFTCLLCSYMLIDY